jgi:phasin family protein
MPAEKFPLFYDAEKVKEFFAAAKLPVIDTDAVLTAQRKNMDALIEANKAVIAGYQEVFKRQAALAEAAVAQTKDKINELQGQPLSAEQFTRNVEAFQTAVQQSINDARELAELAQKANLNAFEIVKDRVVEAVAEFKQAAEKAAA